MTTTDYNNKNIYRLSTSGLINENIKSEDSNKSSSVYKNSLYYGMDDLNRKEIELTSVQSPKKILNNKNVFDWPRMVQTASRNFEKMHRGSDNVFFNENNPKIDSIVRVLLIII
ncbi:unnamed protein product [Brachionus calyciflorus]|uniref:Uncharacterized protein n=1 Tax=Brachionus calyciflorus TaxID=104777 RepID=A0A814EGV2_9BILA|nr:unnamed protein product [Brachionus calyciflorus]